MTNLIARVSATVLLMSFWMPPGAFAQLIKLRAAYSAESSWSLATWVAYEGGCFKKYGLDVDLILIRSASIITAALLGGEAPMIQLGGNGTIQAALQGADCVNVLTLVPLIPKRSWKAEVTEVPPPPASKELKRRWSHFIRKVYETDPLVCPKCSGEMRIISFIDQRDVIRKILEHLGLWEEAHAPPDRGPPQKQITFDPSYSQLL
ncbi:MAG: hypothetical protein HY694_15835 [Deltaproteobacteria bacterium]|nr:hypothetical protein [Deltaproteobacteria bacterium]